MHFIYTVWKEGFDKMRALKITSANNLEDDQFCVQLHRKPSNTDEQLRWHIWATFPWILMQFSQICDSSLSILGAKEVKSRGGGGRGSWLWINYLFFFSPLKLAGRSRNGLRSKSTRLLWVHQQRKGQWQLGVYSRSSGIRRGELW